MPNQKQTVDSIPNTNEIGSFLHCGLCVKEWQTTPVRFVQSPAEYQSVQVGFTPQGLQVWCKRHDCNVVHIHFEGQQHPANLTRAATEADND